MKILEYLSNNNNNYKQSHFEQSDEEINLKRNAFKMFKQFQQQIQLEKDKEQQIYSMFQ